MLRCLADEGEGRAHGELSLSLVGDDAIRALNRDYRDKDRATDVLAFPLGGELLGDVIVSVDTARRRVRPPQWTLDDELAFLTLHGVLHLLGHDHLEPEERATMEAAEQAVWTALGRAGTLRGPEEER